MFSQEPRGVTPQKTALLVGRSFGTCLRNSLLSDCALRFAASSFRCNAEVGVAVGATVRRQVFLGSRHSLLAYDLILISVAYLWFSFCTTPYLTRGRVSNLLVKLLSLLS
jgi:hypothetical protein